MSQGETEAELYAKNGPGSVLLSHIEDREDPPLLWPVSETTTILSPL